MEDSRERFAAAIKDTYDGSEELRPGQQRKHIFDFEDGLRLMVSRDHYQTQEGEDAPEIHGIHVSASLAEDPSLAIYDRIREAIRANLSIAPITSAERVLDATARERFLLLSGFEGPFPLAAASESGVLHYNVPIEVWKQG